MPKIAVITMTRDRLDYTKVCLNSLWKLAGCEFDHYVLDNGSEDGTTFWLVKEFRHFKRILLSKENLGLAGGFNILLSILDGKYDVVIKYDNDCLILKQDTLKNIVNLMESQNWKITVSPRVSGLNKPPKTEPQIKIGEFRLSELNHFGGIFYPIPGKLATPMTGKLFLARGLDWLLSERMRQNGVRLFYSDDYQVEHFEGTSNQAIKYPEYFERKKTEEGIEVIYGS